MCLLLVAPSVAGRARGRKDARVPRGGPAVTIRPRRVPGAHRSLARARRASRGLEQPPLAYHVERQRLVADLVEEHDHRAAVLVALHDALAPLGVRDARAERERLAGRVGALHLAGAAVVAAPAWDAVERLAEVRQDELAPAAVGLGEGAHHLQARALELAAVLLLVERLVDGLLERRRARPGRDVAGRQHLHRSGVLEARDGGRELGLRQLGALLQVGGVDRVAGRADDLGHLAELVDADVARAGEEAPQAEVLGAVEQDGPRGLRVAPGAADLLVVGV